MSSAFLEAVLGAAGAAALQRLDASGAAAYVVPRAALAWLRGIPTPGYAGEVPGTDVCVVLHKAAGAYDGCIGTLVKGYVDAEYAFEAASEAHVAGALAVFLGARPATTPARPAVLARLAKLGRNIDLLAKAAQAAPGPEPTPEAPRAKVEKPPAPPQRRTQPQRGQHHAPTPPEGHAPQTKEGPAKRKLLKIRVPEAKAKKRCGTCDQPLFKDGKFVGCDCFAAMAKSVTTTPVPGGVELTFGEPWDRDAVLALEIL